MPRKENRPYFQIEQFPMGLDKDSLKIQYEKKVEQTKMRWSHNDSLDFLFALIGAEEYDEAEQFFKKNQKIKPRNLEELHLLQYLYSYKRRYKKMIKWLEYERDQFGDSLEAIPLRQRIHDVEELVLSNQWSKDSVVFPELVQLNKKRFTKGSKDFMEMTLPAIIRIDHALRIETKYEFESNRTLAIAFMQFGVFLEKNLSTTDAFIALSVAKYYDKFNSEINEEYRRIRSLMNERNLIFPSFREIFPKQTRGYFNMKSILARREAKNREESAIEKNPEMLLMEEVESNAKIEKPWGIIITLGGLVLMLLFVLIFFKTKE